MSKVVQFSEAEVAEPADFDKISQFAQDADDQIVGGAIGYPHHWAAFTISETSGAELSVNPGRLFAGEIVYAADAAIPVNLQVHLPLVLGDQRWVALLVRGKVNTITDSRLVEVDADTEETVLQAVPKTVSRDVEIVIQQGNPSPTPLKPAVAADQCCLAYVLLKTTGIDTIEPGELWRAKTLYEVEGRVTSIEVTLASALQSISTIKTDIANIAARLGDIPRPELMRQLQRDAAMTRRKIDLPPEARAYWYDNGLLQDQWDKAHADWLARVKEGVRFSYAAERDAQLGLVDESAASIKIAARRLLLPDWTETPRIVVAPDGAGGSKNISQLVHTVTNAVRREIARSAVDYGPTMNVCENNSEWSFIGSTYPGQMFTKNGETFINDGLLVTNEYAGLGHRAYNIRQVYVREWKDVYWDYVTETYGVNGSVYGQSFLNSQPCIVTSIDLNFTRVGSDGDVHLFLCEASSDGAPQFDKVIETATLTQPQLALGWVKFSIRPTLLEAGKRYAWFTVTTGNHALAQVSGNKFAQGTQFYSGDGAFAAGDPEVDFVMRINVAQFRATRVEVEFQPVTLTDGMTEFGLLYSGWTPGGTGIVWMIKPSGADAWSAIEGAADDTLTGLPALVQLKAVFVGTTDLMPAIVLDAFARVMSRRHRGDMRAVSKDIVFGLTSSSIVVETRVDNFDPVTNTFANKLLVGGSVISPSATTVVIDFAKPSRRTYTSTFTLGAPAASARVRPEATTSNALKVPFIQDISLYAL